MRNRLSPLAKILATSALLAAGSGAAVAGPIVVDAGWYGFCFAGVGSPATAGCQNDGVGVTGNTITFTALSSVVLKVTDAFVHGDEFDVNIFGVGNFATSAVAAGGGTTTNPDLAYADPLYSHGSWLLAAGSYSVDIFANTSPSGGGGAYVEVLGAVPEPSTYALLAFGLAGVAAVARRRRAD